MVLRPIRLSAILLALSNDRNWPASARRSSTAIAVGAAFYAEGIKRPRAVPQFFSLADSRGGSYSTDSDGLMKVPLLQSTQEKEISAVEARGCTHYRRKSKRKFAFIPQGLNCNNCAIR